MVPKFLQKLKIQLHLQLQKSQLIQLVYKRKMIETMMITYTNQRKNRSEIGMTKKNGVRERTRGRILDENGNPLPREERKPKKKIACLIGYCGTGYHGMQLNPPHKTIEGDLFDAFVKSGAISRDNSNDLKKSSFQRAARTDKGVHASGNVISLKMIIEDPEVLSKINSHLPDQIRVWGMERVNKTFDCRKMCSSRIYEYLLPTYSLLPPKPTSPLGKQVTEAKIQFPGVARDDKEGQEWWDSVYTNLRENSISDEQIEIALNGLINNQEDTKIETETSKLIKRIKKLDNEFRRSYRISQERLQLLRDAMQQYIGHHNFHNYTLGKHFKDPSSNRYMKSITVSDPFVIEGTEWCSIKIHGQSFMLHQIRKMIAMATLVVRCGCPLDRISQAFGPDKINIPKAPALGLLLEQPVYEGYNSKLESFGYNPIEFTKYEKEMQDFKMKYIYDKIYKEESQENVFYGFFAFIDGFNGDHQIFSFLTAKGIEKLTKDELKEFEIPNEKKESNIEE
ncbi:hypothetical protein PACTADRAFT_75399 [Pachysolen tannophilus NRRL Y-2460]|uniref:tRNA pseudouridine synthase 1 n=1 Tax=Pachysolen tannophilus NRRL Y-2460 TaxID=669874 RepID=A0A1E4TWY1_PACTA|nr:hypothetical protein PACTADRAFT_75399 [Pachysolen tannophilus NRRL Y-2460]